MSVSAFTGLAENYARYRPTYATAAVAALVEFFDQLPHGDRRRNFIVDVGSGTGISTRALTAAFSTRAMVVGMEPNREMIEAATRQKEGDRPSVYIRALAEQIPFPHQAVTLVVAAQSYQWFDRPQFLEECKRILRTGGGLAILQNNRNWRRSPLLDGYESFLERYSPGYQRTYRSFEIISELRVSGFAAPACHQWGWIRRMDEHDFLGMSLSSTKFRAACSKHEQGKILRELRRLLRMHVPERCALELPYVTELYLARIRIARAGEPRRSKVSPELSPRGHRGCSDAERRGRYRNRRLQWAFQELEIRRQAQKARPADYVVYGC